MVRPPKARDDEIARLGRSVEILAETVAHQSDRINELERVLARTRERIDAAAAGMAPTRIEE